MAGAELAQWALNGNARDGAFVARLEGGEIGSAQVFVAGKEVVKITVIGEAPALGLLDEVVRDVAGRVVAGGQGLDIVDYFALQSTR